MPTYKVRIKPNTHHGSGSRRHEGGETMIVTQDEVRSFGDKFDILDEIPDEEPRPAPPPEVEQAVDEVGLQVDAIIAQLEERFGPPIEEEVEPQTVAQLKKRMEDGDVPNVDDVVGPKMAGKLESAGLGDSIMIYYAADGDITAIDGIGVGTLRKLRDVYGKA